MEHMNFHLFIYLFIYLSYLLHMFEYQDRLRVNSIFYQLQLTSAITNN